MEKIRMKKNSRKYDFHAGEEFKVLRTIMDDIVVIRQPDKLNIRMSVREAMYYGELTGTPQLG